MVLILEADLDDRGLSRGLRRIQGNLDDTEDRAASLQRRLRGMQETGQAVFGFLARGAAVVGAGLVAAATGIAALTLRAGESADELLRWNNITGLQVRELDALRRIARRAGLDLDVFTEAQIAAVDKAQAAILQGGDALLDFQREFNLDAERFVGLNPQQQLFEMSRALISIENPTLRAAVASALFGDEAVKLLPALERLAEQGFNAFINGAESTGRLLDRQSATTLLNARSSWLGLQERIAAAGTALAVIFAPALQSGLDAINRIIDNESSGGLEAFLDRISGKIEAFFGGTGEVEVVTGTRTSQFESLVEDARTALNTIAMLFSEDSSERQASADAIVDWLFGVKETVENGLADLAESFVNVLAVEVRDAVLDIVRDPISDTTATGLTLVMSSIVFSAGRKIAGGGIRGTIVGLVAALFAQAKTATDEYEDEEGGLADAIVDKLGIILAAGLVLFPKIGVPAALGAAIGLFASFLVGEIFRAFGDETTADRISSAVESIFEDLINGNFSALFGDLASGATALGSWIVDRIGFGIETGINALIQLVDDAITGIVQTANFITGGLIGTDENKQYLPRVTYTPILGGNSGGQAQPNGGVPTVRVSTGGGESGVARVRTGDQRPVVVVQGSLVDVAGLNRAVNDAGYSGRVLGNEFGGP